ncbi:MAG: T9SS type A sorting domain-containing protein [Ignavibacteriaceae bacterium]|nr:T9SS type A sorting domain-containing protein [Ignavibacteriaceae bacterium]
MASYEKCRIRYTVYTQTDSVSTITPEGFYIIGVPVIAEDLQNEVPEEFILHQNYPNPFNPSTKIKFTISAVETTRRVVFTTLKVYDILGNEIATLVNDELAAGEYEVVFNVGQTISPSRGVSARGGYASGVYFYQLRAGNFVQTKKMSLLR